MVVDHPNDFVNNFQLSKRL